MANKGKFFEFDLKCIVFNQKRIISGQASLKIEQMRIFAPLFKL